MKNIFIIIISVFTFSFVQAQEKSNSKISESSFAVKGVCNMCKDRIEAAAMRTKGVKLAEWNKQEQLLEVTYRNDKTSVENIQQAVAAVGHETEKEKADTTAYSKLPGCCKYADGAKCGN